VNGLGLRDLINRSNCTGRSSLLTAAEICDWIWPFPIKVSGILKLGGVKEILNVVPTSIPQVWKLE
jgi:hypothetical protein